MKLSQLRLDLLWYPPIAYWLTTYCQVGQTFAIVIDRPQWTSINLLMVSLLWENRAIPLYWTLLPKLGSSNVTEQISAIDQVLALLEDYQVVLLGDA
ncbi:hypothetical protein QUB56_08270 [Microcoleus sp. AR_TQ3_B6]|uniref:hypothetical protein n=1 Tax=Microcoleus sp. AR_TQ3_B6 TaxID=3055284 RepID=UPI002FD3D6A0